MVKKLIYVVNKNINLKSNKRLT